MAHLSNSDLQAFLKQELRGERLLEIDDHLSECADCREALENGPEAARALRYMESTFAGSHLDFEEFQMLMEGGQVPAEVMRHAAACKSCAAELADLKCYAEGVAEIPRVSRPKLQIVPSRFVAPVRPWSIQPGWYGLAAAVLLIVSTSLVVRHRMLPAKDDVASLRDGGSELSIDRSGELHGDESVEGAYRDQLRLAMATGRLQVAPLNFSTQQRETLLSAPAAGTASPKASFELLSPVGRVAVDDPPTFRWQAVTGARSYRVIVYGANYAKISESPEVQGTEWQLAVALPAGGVYTWTVTAETASGSVREPAPPQPEAVFRTMDADVAAALREAEAHHADDSLLFAVLYAHAGSVVEARAAIDKLAAQNPDSPLVAQLRASLPQDPSPIKSNAAQ
jgi:hypothetical protein